jgi:hypothetical protein
LAQQQQQTYSVLILFDLVAKYKSMSEAEKEYKTYMALAKASWLAVETLLFLHARI